MKKPNLKTIAITAFVTMAVTLSFFFLLFYGVTK
jgi:regulatory protein YycH of two-component signal transduction system YycFG